MLTELTGDEDDLRRHSHGTPSSRQHRRGVPDTPEPVGREYAQTLIFGSPSLRGTQNSLSRVVQGGLDSPEPRPRSGCNRGDGAAEVGVPPSAAVPEAWSVYSAAEASGAASAEFARHVAQAEAAVGAATERGVCTGARPRCRWRWASRRSSSCEWVEALARRRAAGTSPPRAAAARPRFGKARAQRRLLPRALLGRLQLT